MAPKTKPTATTKASELPPGSTLPLVQLIEDLELYAIALGSNPQRYTLPPGWPSRLYVPISYVVAGRWQPRSVFVDAELNDLAESIREHGVINPPLVFVSEHGKLELIAGERRLRAATLAGLTMIPVEIREGTPRELHQLSIVDNIQREDLKPWEEGQAYERMIAELDISEAELSRQMGKNRAYIQQRRALANAAPELCQALADGKLNFAVVRGIIAGAAGNHDVQRQATELAIRQVTGGVVLDESRARKLASDTTIKQLSAQVQALGWKLSAKGDGKVLLWADSQRPREASEKELTQLVAEGKRPGGQVPAVWEKDKDISAILSMRGLMIWDNSCQPWLKIGELGTGNSIRFVSGAEMPDVARQAVADLDAMEARALDSGWELRRVSTTTIFFVRGDQMSRSCYGYDEHVKLVDQLVAGTAELQPRQRCAICSDWVDSGPSRYQGSDKIHTACYQAPAPTLAAPVQIEQGEIPMWLLSIPEEDLRAIAFFLAQDDIVSASPIDTIHTTITCWLDQCREEYGALDQQEAA